MSSKLFHPTSLGRLRLIKSKLLTVAFIAILLYSALSVALVMSQAPGWEICDYCDGTGEITTEEICPTCLGTGEMTPTITFKSKTAWKSDGAVVVRAMVENEGDSFTFGWFIAEVDIGGTTYKGTKDMVMLRPHEEIAVDVEISGFPSDVYIPNTVSQFRIWLSKVNDITCSDCDGTEWVSVTSKCPYCGGTGFVAVEEGGGEQGGGLNIPLDIGGAALGVAVVAGVAITTVVVVKKRKVSEKGLRKLPLQEFQNWVLKKLEGKPPSLRDSRLGIDGYTMEGRPISIKQSDGVGRDVIEKFASAMGQSRAKNGIIVAYSFGNDAYTGTVKAKLNYGLEIQMVTVKDLIESRKRPL